MARMRKKRMRRNYSSSRRPSSMKLMMSLRRARRSLRDARSKLKTWKMYSTLGIVAFFGWFAFSGKLKDAVSKMKSN